MTDLPKPRFVRTSEPDGTTDEAAIKAATDCEAVGVAGYDAATGECEVMAATKASDPIDEAFASFNAIMRSAAYKWRLYSLGIEPNKAAVYLPHGGAAVSRAVEARLAEQIDLAARAGSDVAQHVGLVERSTVERLLSQAWDDLAAATEALDKLSAQRRIDWLGRLLGRFDATRDTGMFDRTLIANRQRLMALWKEEAERRALARWV